MHYSWLSPDGTPVGSAGKLTTWKPGVENKMLDLAMPSVAPTRRTSAIHPTPSVTLLLWATPTLGPLSARSTDFISLTDTRFGRTPFPLLSLPIYVNAASNPKTKHPPRVQKQEKIERRILLPECRQTPDDRGGPYVVTLREETSYDLDKVPSRVAITLIFLGFLTGHFRRSGTLGSACLPGSQMSPMGRICMIF